MAGNAAELIAQGKDVTKVLTDPQRMRLKACESIIRKGLGTFLEVGQALAEIHDNRLYKETHKDFRLYCRDVWDLGKSRAHQQIEGYRVVQLLEEKMSTIGGRFTNERQLRPLTRLKEDADRLKVAGIVKETLDQNPKAKLTGAMVNKAAKEVKGETAKRKVKETKKQVESTQLVSKLFKNQYQVMVDIISEEQDSGWKNASKKEVIKWLETLVKMVVEED